MATRAKRAPKQSSKIVAESPRAVALAAIWRGDINALRAALSTMTAAELAGPEIAESPLVHAALGWELMHIGLSDETPMLDALLDSGVDPNAIRVDDAGKTPALQVSTSRTPALLRLLRAGADPEALVVSRPGERSVATVRALANHEALASIARFMPQPELFSGLAGDWELIAETWEESGSRIEEPTERPASLTFRDDGSFECDDIQTPGLRLGGTWTTATPFQPSALSTKGALRFHEDGESSPPEPEIAFEYRSSYLGRIGSRVSLRFSNDSTGGHGAVTYHFARCGAFHRTPQCRTPLLRPLELPQVVRTVPAARATGVSTDLERLTIEFSEPMDQSSTAFIFHSRIETIGSPGWRWESPTTCILPVKLTAGQSHRVWLNNEQIVGFRSVDGRPAEPLDWAFETARD